MCIYSAICMYFPKSNKAQFVIEYTIRLTPSRSPYKCRISCVLIRVAIDGSAVQNEKIVFINICSINQTTVSHNSYALRN